MQLIGLQNNVKFLGIKKIDNKLTWKDHVNEI